MTQLIFVVDPMCSWCWGFHPVIQDINENHTKTHTTSLVLGGLRTKGQMDWNSQNIHYLKKKWDAVSTTTKQPFNFNLFGKKL